MPFKKGDKNINRAGRPKGKSIKDTLEVMLEQDVQDMTKREALCKKVISLAFAGDSWAMKEIFDRIDGKPHQSISQDVDTHVHVTREIVGETVFEEEEDLTDPEVD